VELKDRDVFLKMLGRVLPLLENLHSSGTARDTAALIANLDHVITVDTAVAHLSGALGIPTSVLLWSVPDWRWMLHRPDNAWYPTMRLYRKKRRGRWPEVLDRIASSLRHDGTLASKSQRS
jgi:ADP-heptose:LPS heptosyltransferase